MLPRSNLLHLLLYIWMKMVLNKPIIILIYFFILLIPFMFLRKKIELGSVFFLFPMVICHICSYVSKVHLYFSTERTKYICKAQQFHYKYVTCKSTTLWRSCNSKIYKCFPCFQTIVGVGQLHYMLYLFQSCCLDFCFPIVYIYSLGLKCTYYFKVRWLRSFGVFAICFCIKNNVS